MSELDRPLGVPAVIDCTAACARHDAQYTPVALDKRLLLVVHRTGVGATAEEVAAAFTQHPELGPVTGWQMPYTFVITRSGRIEQALPVTDLGPHARAWNVAGIGVGVVGDFTAAEPTPKQWHALLVLGHVCSGWLGGVDAVVGHDELPRSSADAKKQCPGPLLSMERLRAEIRVADRARVKCFGVVF